MRILFLTQIVPYPPDAGPKVKTWNVLRHLAGSGHKIILATFVRPEEEQFLPALREVCSEVLPVPMRRSRLTNLRYLIQSYIKRVPFLVERDNLPQMRRIVREKVENGEVDLVHCDQFTMAQFALDLEGQIPRVFDAHNATWKVVERTAAQYPWYLQPVLHREIKLVKEYEEKIIRSFEHTFAVTTVDRGFLLELVPDDMDAIANRISSTPISVDCEAIQPLQRSACSHCIVTLGTLHYPPNADGIRWFLREVFPKIQAQLPDAHLKVIGKNPPEDFLLEAKRSPNSVTVTGYVPDLVPHFQDSALMVVPVRSGGGMRVRILEAFAYAMPVVTTSTGLEGIDAVADRDVLIADTPEEYAEAVIRLLTNPELQRQLAENGRKLAEQNYHWQKALQSIDETYEQLHAQAAIPMHLHASRE